MWAPERQAPMKQTCAAQESLESAYLIPTF